MKLLALIFPIALFGLKATKAANVQGNKVSTENKSGIDGVPIGFNLTETESALKNLVYRSVEKFPLSQSLNAERKLTSFTERLQEYMNESSFDVDRFEAKSKDFERDLYEIELPLQDHYHYKELLEKLLFARRIFGTMVNAIKKLKIYPDTGTLEQHLVHCTIQLNVRLLALYDYNGSPNISIPGFEEKVIVHTQSLMFWNRLFRRLRNVPVETHVVFVNQFNRAWYILKSFEQEFLPK